MAARRLITEPEEPPPAPTPGPAAADDADADHWSSGRLGENMEDDADADRAEEEAENGYVENDGLDAAAAADGVVAGDVSNRLPRVDLSEDVIIEAADDASFALSFSCTTR